MLIEQVRAIFGIKGFKTTFINVVVSDGNECGDCLYLKEHSVVSKYDRIVASCKIFPQYSLATKPGVVYKCEACLSSEVEDE